MPQPSSASVTLPEQALAERVRGDYANLAAQSAGQDPRAWERRRCRVCHAEGLVEILSLGMMPPANALLRSDELQRAEPRFPLELKLCQSCGLVQLGHVVPPELLFRSYLFFTSTSRVMVEHFGNLMNDAADRYVPPGGLVVEIGSNDGTALSSIRRRDVRVLGVDPARNIAVMSASRGVPTVSEFFTEPLAREVRRVAGPAHLIVACNVLGHIDDLDDTFAGIAALLADNGALVFEVPYLRDLLDRCEYDTIYHEHLSYFAIRPILTLLSRHGLRLERVQNFPVHGGTIRVTAVRGSGADEDAAAWVQRENEAGLHLRSAFDAFVATVQSRRDWLRQTLADLRRQDRIVLGYGAPAKAAVVLNYCGIGTDLLPAVIDSTPAKQGWCIPGTRQPILPPSALESRHPDVLLLLAWNHAQEILQRETAFRARGGRFITPHGKEL
jgi:novobiocin biosynthesis protein NovU/D-mycarose 3-C-methyltransferase